MTVLDYGTRSLPPAVPWRRLPAMAVVGGLVGVVAAWLSSDHLLWCLAGCQRIVITDLGQPFALQLHLTAALAVSGAVLAGVPALWGPSRLRTLVAGLGCFSLFVVVCSVAVVVGQPVVVINGAVPAESVPMFAAPAAGALAVIFGCCVILPAARLVAAQRPAT